MPRRALSSFSQLQQHARRLLASLANEIRSKKVELARLEQELEQLTGLAGLRGGTPAAARTRKAVGRINWSEMLAKLPKEFKASDISGVRGLKSKRPSELFAAVTRWIDSGVVKKKARGVYLRTK
ncbi:MAG: hypothetical protein ACLQAT_14755 [Candidatus Binataceae bacterium]